MSARKPSRKGSTGRVTPKGTRPPGANKPHEHGERGYDPHDTGGGRPAAAPSRDGATAPKTFRTGHRGG